MTFKPPDEIYVWDAVNLPRLPVSMKVNSGVADTVSKLWSCQRHAYGDWRRKEMEERRWQRQPLEQL